MYLEILYETIVLFDGTKVGMPVFTKRGPLITPAQAAGPSDHRSSLWYVALNVVRPQTKNEANNSKEDSGVIANYSPLTH